MPRKSLPKSKQDDPEQFKRFVKTAKEIGAHADAKKFDTAFKKITSKNSRRDR